MKEIELWADSFHEGDWACRQLVRLHGENGLRSSFTYENGFLPVYVLHFPDGDLTIRVYGSYDSWSPQPSAIAALLSWGKPDLIAYDAEAEAILFAAEETAAVPTGNQALQRCERLYGASRAGIPFWYLLAEYGVHRDEGLRRDSIWPTVMALKLSLHNQAPSMILHYADKANPEGYDFGNGVRSLALAMYQMLQNVLYGQAHLFGMQQILREHFKDMLRFLSAQYMNITKYLPGLQHFENDRLLDDLVDATYGRLRPDFNEAYPGLLCWPNVEGWLQGTSAPVQGSKLIKHDELAQLLESSIDIGKCYVTSSNAGSRPQRGTELGEWLQWQNRAFGTACSVTGIDSKLELHVSQFPKSTSGNHHVTTAKNILYLFDTFADLRPLIYTAFPRLSSKLDDLDHSPAMVYLSNSVKPGRIFGDPFTGQISAFATIFGKFDEPRRLVIAYFPHQSFSQFLDSDRRLVRNKGFVLMRELVDVVILGGGIAIRFGDDGRAYAI